MSEFERHDETELSRVMSLRKTASAGVIFIPSIKPVERIEDEVEMEVVRRRCHRSEVRICENEGSSNARGSPTPLAGLQRVKCGKTKENLVRHR